MSTPPVVPGDAYEDFINAVRDAFCKRWPHEVTPHLWDTIRAAMLAVARPALPAPEPPLDTRNDKWRAALDHEPELLAAYVAERLRFSCDGLLEVVYPLRRKADAG